MKTHYKNIASTMRKIAKISCKWCGGNHSERECPDLKDVKCEKCQDFGWVRGHELDNPDDVTNFSRQQRYACDRCKHGMDEEIRKKPTDAQRRKLVETINNADLPVAGNPVTVKPTSVAMRPNVES